MSDVKGSISSFDLSTNGGDKSEIRTKTSARKKIPMRAKIKDGTCSKLKFGGQSP
jgi:hypothetical protein